jgi:hypothetical protein
MQPLI